MGLDTEKRTDKTTIMNLAKLGERIIKREDVIYIYYFEKHSKFFIYATNYNFF